MTTNNNSHNCPLCSSPNTELSPIYTKDVPKALIKCLEHTCGASFEKTLDSSLTHET